MQKVVYGVSRVNRDEKLKGIGYLIDGNLFVPATSNKGNLYIRIFEGVEEKCKPVPAEKGSDHKNEFKGFVDVIYTDVPIFKSVDHDSDERKEGSYEVIDSLTVSYYVWYKKLD